MEIPSSSIINQYIACQGPLPNTCPDFWQMTWEQGSAMVVMLTTQVERGRVSPSCDLNFTLIVFEKFFGEFTLKDMAIRIIT